MTFWSNVVKIANQIDGKDEKFSKSFLYLWPHWISAFVFGVSFGLLLAVIGNR